MKLLLNLCIIIIFIAAFSVHAQNAPQKANDQGVVQDLGSMKIKIKIETPQVAIYSKRIKPEFDDVKIDRSFRKELIGENEKINLKQHSDNAEYYRIDVEQLMKKLR
jgi:hypothetical protein